MFPFGVDSTLVSFGMEVGIIDGACFIHRDGGGDGAFLLPSGPVEKGLQGIGFYHHVRFYNEQAGIGPEGFLLGHLQHQQIVGRGVVGHVRQVDQTEAVLAGCFLQPGGVLGGAEVVVHRILAGYGDG